jgi:hypothetical protein
MVGIDEIPDFLPESVPFAHEPRFPNIIVLDTIIQSLDEFPEPLDY